jgi:hypothetical protein
VKAKVIRHIIAYRLQVGSQKIGWVQFDSTPDQCSASLSIADMQHGRWDVREFDGADVDSVGKMLIAHLRRRWRTNQMRLVDCGGRDPLRSRINRALANATGRTKR